DRLLGDHREGEGDEQREDRGRGVEAAQKEAVEENAEEADRDRRQRHRREEAEIVGECDSGVGAERIESAVREIDDAADAEDQRQAERDQQVVAAEDEAIDHLFEQEHQARSLADGVIALRRCSICFVVPARRHRVHPMSATISAHVGYSRLAMGIHTPSPVNFAAEYGSRVSLRSPGTTVQLSLHALSRLQGFSCFVGAIDSSAWLAPGTAGPSAIRSHLSLAWPFG